MASIANLFSVGSVTFVQLERLFYEIQKIS